MVPNCTNVFIDSVIFSLFGCFLNIKKIWQSDQIVCFLVFSLINRLLQFIVIQNITDKKNYKLNA